MPVTIPDNPCGRSKVTVVIPPEDAMEVTARPTPKSFMNWSVVSLVILF